MDVPPECKLRGSVSLEDGCRYGPSGDAKMGSSRSRWPLISKAATASSVCGSDRDSDSAAELEAAEARNFVSKPFAHIRVEAPVVAGGARANVSATSRPCALAHARAQQPFCRNSCIDDPRAACQAWQL